MQILVIFEIEGTFVWQVLLGARFWIMLSCFVIIFTDILEYSLKQKDLYSSLGLEENL